MSDFTVYEKMVCAEREVRLRKFSRARAQELFDLKRQGATVDRWGKPILMKKDPDFDKMDYQIRCMQEVADEYRSQWDGVVPQLNVAEGYMV